MIGRRYLKELVREQLSSMTKQTIDGVNHGLKTNL